MKNLIKLFSKKKPQEKSNDLDPRGFKTVGTLPRNWNELANKFEKNDSLTIQVFKNTYLRQY